MRASRGRRKLEVIVVIGVIAGVVAAVAAILTLVKRDGKAARGESARPATEDPRPDLAPKATAVAPPRATIDKPTVFISYSHQDEDWKDLVLTHLGVAQHESILELWDDRRISGGDDWEQEIRQAMDAASLAVLLVSANFLTSDFILKDEVPRLLQRRAGEGLRIFPIVIKPCDWEAVGWLARMQLRPKDGRPVSAGDEHQIDADLAAIAREIRLLLSATVQLSKAEKWAPIPRDDVSISRLPVTGEHLFGRELELDLLNGAWADETTNVISLVAWGGVGKSALVNGWLAEMAKTQFRGAERVYGWSFYSQGTRETAASADQFIAAALTRFGDDDPAAGSPWDKGERLAGLIRRERTLLVLDGLEPLQHPPGPEEGKLTDPALAALVRELAASNPGLCVITTRQRVADLGGYAGATAPVVGLENLSEEAGAALLRALEVQGSEEELRQASRDFGGHGLALNLLGSYLRDVCEGDVGRRGEVALLEEDAARGGHAGRVMASYETWLGEGPALAVLRLIGLFDRPAEAGSVKALRAPPAIAGLTEPLIDLTEPQWQRTLARLRRAGLLAEADAHAPDALDAHPLVREYFGGRLREGDPEAWRQGNDRLYEHLKAAADEYPDTLLAMAPLYAAVAHGCAAGRHQEALEEVYDRRIQRGNEFFSTKKLGAFGAELAALFGFFASTWDRPADGLPESRKGFVLNEAGFDLRALGRLREAAEPMQAALEADTVREDWRNAARDAQNVSELNRTIGDLTRSEEYGQQGVDLAERSGEAFERMACRAALASALHQVGRRDEAEALFCEAEAMQKERQAQYPLLYSLQGFQYCDLLLDQRKYREVQDRAVQTLEWVRKERWLLDIAHDHLSLGRAQMLQSQVQGTGDLAEAADHLDNAVGGLREAGQQHFVPPGLLARAALHRLNGDLDRARRDLDEALTIAERGGMGLYQADAHLEYARLHHEMGDKAAAQDSLAVAKEMIADMGYHRRDDEVAALEGQLE